MNSLRITIVWNVTALSQRVDNTSEAYIFITHSITLRMYECI